MKSLLSWILAAGLCAGASGLFVSCKAKESEELIQLREQVQQLASMQTALEEATNQVKVLSDELVVLRGEKQELLRLRNEIGQMRTQLQGAKAEAQRAQAQITQASQAGAQQLQQLQNLQTENQALRSTTTQVQQASLRNGCINTLRQLDGAKQQWALEHSKTADAVPGLQEIAPYLPGPPVCPAGGTYTLNAVGQPVTCSIPGHALPK
jgi:outer membrane murein-binding lipoprotein Lpp